MLTTAQPDHKQDLLSVVGPSPSQVRLSGLDGIRGLAALIVVLHHCWLMSFPGYPADNGPRWAGWLLYGHLAVVVFIVLSGFSLGVGPARAAWRLDSLRRYAHRRAWRILPPYWPALIFSLVVAWFVVPQSEAAPTAKSVVIYGLLLQDVFGAPSPNGAFWSIAVEAQLYLLLPLGLMILRKTGGTVLLVATLVPVLFIGIVAPSVPAVHLLTRFTPQFAVGFTSGMLAAGVAGNNRLRRYPWQWLALGAALPALGLIVVRGSVWTVEHYFWVDLAVMPAIALLLAAIAAGTRGPLVWFLDTAPLRRLGAFSYSLYLVHAPIIVAVALLIVSPRVIPGVPAFLVTLAIGVPLALIFARLFAAVFDLPFQRHKSFPGLRNAVLARIRIWRLAASRLAPRRDRSSRKARAPDLMRQRDS
jgi:peptidoglycan/LPS O-acetylase OafA/YrhL